MGDAGLNLEPEASEMTGHQLRSLHLAVPQLRMLVDSVAVVHHLRRDPAGGGRYGRIVSLCLERQERRSERHYQNEGGRYQCRSQVPSLELGVGK
jgi:hypothetical protein